LLSKQGVFSQRLLLVTLLAVCGVSSAVSAQEGNRFAVGGSFTHRGVGSSTAHGGRGPGIQWRIGHSTEGWGWQYGLNWYSLDVDRPIAGRSTPLGELRVRPFMGGYGYTHLMGPVAVTVDAIGGYALTRFDLTSEAANAYRERLGAGSLSAHMSNTPVVKPEVSLWVDVTRKVGLMANAGYIIARPRFTVSSTLGSDVERYRADAMSITVGAVYRIF